MLFLSFESTFEHTSFSFESTFVFPSESLSKFRCFGLCLASRCTLCDFTGTVRCHMRI